MEPAVLGNGLLDLVRKFKFSFSLFCNFAIDVCNYLKGGVTDGESIHHFCFLTSFVQTVLPISCQLSGTTPLGPCLW